MLNLAFATSRKVAVMPRDESLLEAALRPHGVRATPVAWDTPGLDWSRFDAVLIRSTWDYHYKIKAFLAWLSDLEKKGVMLLNPPALVRWNMHKSYLLELAARGVPIVETRLLKTGDRVDLALLAEELKWPELIIKPAISATAHRTFRLRGEDAEEWRSSFQNLLAESDLLVQPYLEEIEQEGELSLIYIGSRFSHAICKLPKKGDFRVQSEFGGRVRETAPEPDIKSQARAILDKVSGDWVYARVDGLLVGGRFLLMELELIEPQLFLDKGDKAAELLAEALSQYLAGRCPSRGRPAHPGL